MNNPLSWGRFSVDGSEPLEARLRELVQQVGEATQRQFGPDELAALLVVGGYGRGEGGVERVGGREEPHNNIDFLLIAHDERRPLNALKARLDSAIEPIRQQAPLGIDVGVSSVQRLRRSPALVFWYDLRFGHKSVLGEPSLMSSMRHFRLNRIPSWDVRNLLTNRGTLLLINAHMRAHGAAQPRQLLRHAMKAIIGYGDALLFAHGRYHWSYQEKRRRMRGIAGQYPSFAQLYDQAMGFRFAPDYATFLSASFDLEAWMAKVEQALPAVHLAFEAFRLRNPALQWPTYLSEALTHALTDEALSAASWARKLRNALRALRQPTLRREPLSMLRHPALANAPARASLGALCSTETNLLSLLFPLVAYGEGHGLQLSDDEASLLASLLAAQGCEPAALRRAYLHTWARYGDINFLGLLQRIEQADATTSLGEEA
ncbi:MAG: hypothetical protein RBU37_06925 [Myxococcota bacterium]|jgi:hypothetical protein|nr:hypothetical protein [Myxococcota bacterium]